MGDREWRNLLESHDVLARTVVEQHRGRLVQASGAMGDGILATFDGPGRAIRCARALNEALRPLGVSIRAGLHTGEIEVGTAGSPKRALGSFLFRPLCPCSWKVLASNLRTGASTS